MKRDTTSTTFSDYCVIARPGEHHPIDNLETIPTWVNASPDFSRWCDRIERRFWDEYYQTKTQ